MGPPQVGVEFKLVDVPDMKVCSSHETSVALESGAVPISFGSWSDSTFVSVVLFHR